MGLFVSLFPKTDTRRPDVGESDRPTTTTKIKIKSWKYHDPVIICLCLILGWLFVFHCFHYPNFSHGHWFCSQIGDLVLLHILRSFSFFLLLWLVLVWFRLLHSSICFMMMSKWNHVVIVDGYTYGKYISSVSKPRRAVRGSHGVGSEKSSLPYKSARMLWWGWMCVTKNIFNVKSLTFWLCMKENPPPGTLWEKTKTPTTANWKNLVSLDFRQQFLTLHTPRAERWRGRWYGMRYVDKQTKNKFQFLIGLSERFNHFHNRKSDVE